MPTRVARLGHEAPPVTGALAPAEHLDLGDVATPGQHRLEAVPRRIVTERGEAVQRDAAANRVEPRLREAERGRTVREMARHAVEGLG